MKIIFLLTATVLLSLTAFGQDVEIAIKYNDRIVELNEGVNLSLEKLIDSYETYLPEEMDSSYAMAIGTVNYAIDKIKRLAPLENDSSFKFGAFELFKTYKRVLENEHVRIIKLLKLPQCEYGEKQIKEYNKYIEDANNKCDRALNKLLKVQENFAKKFNIGLTTE